MNNVINISDFRPETAKEAWERSSAFHLKQIIQSLRKVGEGNVADCLETYPLVPYLLPGMEKLL